MAKRNTGTKVLPEIRAYTKARTQFESVCARESVVVEHINQYLREANILRGKYVDAYEDARKALEAAIAVLYQALPVDSDSRVSSIEARLPARAMSIRYMNETLDAISFPVLDHEDYDEVVGILELGEVPVLTPEQLSHLQMAIEIFRSKEDETRGKPDVVAVPVADLKAILEIVDTWMKKR